MVSSFFISLFTVCCLFSMHEATHKHINTATTHHQQQQIVVAIVVCRLKFHLPGSCSSQLAQPRLQHLPEVPLISFGWLRCRRTCDQSLAHYLGVLLLTGTEESIQESYEEGASILRGVGALRKAAGQS